MIKDLILGNNYSKKELVEILNEETLKTSREGIFNCKNSLSTLFFVTLDKSSKEENLHYNDFFEEDFFHMFWIRVFVCDRPLASQRTGIVENIVVFSYRIQAVANVFGALQIYSERKF